MSYQIEQKAIVHETIDEEVVIINFASGNYYSLTGVGAFVWNILNHGPSSIENIIYAVMDSCDIQEEFIKSDINSFFSELIREGLVKKLDLDSTSSLQRAEAIKKSYQTPVLEIHTDMKEVIVLDPVHEIDYADF